MFSLRFSMMDACEPEPHCHPEKAELSYVLQHPLLLLIVTFG
jgi:hypothetical protein